MDGSGLSANDAPEILSRTEVRKTARTTAGVPPTRFGGPSAAITSSQNYNPNILGSGRISASVRSETTLSSRTSKSYSSTLQQTQIDVQTEDEINTLEEQHDANERLAQNMEIEVKTLIDSIELMKTDLSKFPSEEHVQSQQLQEQISVMERTLLEKQNDVMKKRTDISFEARTLNRKKAQLRRTAELQKQIVREDDLRDADNLSQKLSDSEEEADDPELAMARKQSELQYRLEKQAQAAAAVFQKCKDAAAPTLLDDDELLIRLRKLQQPMTTNTGPTAAQPTTNGIISPPPVNSNSNTSDQMSEHFAQILAKTFEKIANTSHSTDKFLARQVQGKDLPLFSGRSEEWSLFITAFENTTQGCGFTNQDNLPRLQKCLRGEAAKTVQCLLARPENVPAIIAKLRMRFGRPEHIVQMLITKAKEVPTFREDRLDLLIDFGLAVDNLVETIKALNCPEHLTSPQLLEEFSKKLPVTHRTRWIEWVTSDTNRKENLETFAVWLNIQTEVACRLCPPRWKEEQTQHKSDRWKPRRNNERVWATATTSDQKQDKPYLRDKCLFCDTKGHKVFECSKFKKETTDSKYEWVKSNRHCFCCLRYGHGARECRKKKECGVGGCQKTHHELLHQQQQQQPRQVRFEATTETITYASKSIDTLDKSHVNLMILPVQLKGPKCTISTYAFLDPGATVTVIDNDIATKLGLKGNQEPFTHSGLHPSITEVDSRIVSLKILNSSGNKTYRLNKVRTVKKLSLPRQSVRTKMVKKWIHLKDLDIQFYEEGQPTILIGQDNIHLCNTRELILGPPNAPGAGRTELGWVLMGKVDSNCRREYSYVISDQSHDDLHQLVKQHFTTEDFGVKIISQKLRSTEDTRAQNIMDSTVKQIGDCWESGLLWKTDEIQLSSSKDVARSRLLQMERKMDRDPIFAEKYLAKIQEYQDKGFARVLTDEESKVVGSRTFYLPHFMSKNPKKPTKLRFIFDAAAKVQGMSLNDGLLKGPDKLTNLPSVLLKFRQRAIAINADIKDMFHRVRVRKEDSSSQRFLWRGMDRQREPEVMEMGVLIFGAACSPACAQEVKNLNASRFKDKFPASVDAIILNHYVDDYLDSVDTLEEAILRFKEVKFIHQSGGFNLCNWISNCKKFIQEIPEELRSPGLKNLDLEGDAERVLGLFWRPENDSFTFSKTFLKANEEIVNGIRLPTKRELLSLVMSIFDPLGFLAIFTIKAKIILQETWKTGIGWDDEIPRSLQIKWEKWNQELKSIDQFRLPRCYSRFLSISNVVQLHVFCDASEQAFGAVAYFRIQQEGTVTVSFVAAKSKVAPTKHLTIPKLELQAAVLGTRLASFLNSEHTIKIHQTVYWSDSSTVLSWIKSDGKRFVQFVGNRVGEIQESSDVSEWRWVPTKLNVADEMTRDSLPSNFQQDSRWINGPEFLKLSEEHWPQPSSTTKVIPPEELELKKEFMCSVIEEQPIIDISRFSKWNRAIRTMGYVFRFINNCQKIKKNRPNSIELVPPEIDNAECWWWRSSQQESFPEEVNSMKFQKTFPKNSRIVQLTPLMDSQGVIRLRGRLDNADIPDSTKQPVVLDPKHPFTKLLISHYHELGGHHGQERTVNELRQKFHILNIRSAVKKAQINCQSCKNNKAQPTTPLMGQLPLIRLESFVSVFKNTGLDYFGPLNVLVGRRQEKRWVALFTCLSTRAVHVELVSSLSTDSCLMAIRRFVSRRGLPINIFSDNGTNFVGANNELKAALKVLNQDRITAECTTRGISWHFIPPAAPHMGGSWERLVKSIKVALSATLKEVTPREEVLQTLLTEAEHTVNSHPLTHVPIDPDDLEALTPNHFLLGRSSNLQRCGNFDDGDLCSRKQWRRAQRLADTFWRRWIKEYLPTIRKREKWFKTTDPIKVGDIVLLVDHQLTRNSWPLGQVDKIYPGLDGIIRVVEIRTANGIYRRPVSKVCKLEVGKIEPSQVEITN